MVPWQLIAKQTGAVIRHVNLTKDNTEIDMQHYKELLSPRTKLVSLVYVSNMLGAVLDTAYVVEEARKVGTSADTRSCLMVPWARGKCALGEGNWAAG